MLIKLADYIDSLFYTTTMVTTTRRFSPTLVPLEPEVPTSEETEVGGINCIRINGEDYVIPQMILDRPPLFVDDAPNFKSFPNWRNSTILSKYTSDDNQTVLVDGMGVSRNSAYQGWTRKKVDAVFDECRAELVSAHDDCVVVSTEYVDLNLEVLRADRWTYVNISRDGKSKVQIYYQSPMSDNIDTMMAEAYAQTRIIMLMFLAGNDVVYNYREEDLAGHIFALSVMVGGVA